MAVLTAGFETGVSGVDIAPSDPGNATAWDATIRLTGSVKYDNAQAKTGTLSGKIVAGAGASYLAWSAALGTVTDHYGRFYMYIPSIPSGNYGRFFSVYSGDPTTTGVRALTCYVDNAGLMIFNDVTGNSPSFTNPIPTGAWVRMEYHIVHSTTVGQWEWRMFLGDSTSAIESYTSPANRNTLASADTITYGTPDGGNNAWTVYYDAIVANATSFPGPLESAAPQVLSMQTHVFGHGVW